MSPSTSRQTRQSGCPVKKRRLSLGQVVRMRGEGMPLRDDPASFGDLHVKVPKGCQNRAKQSHCHCQRCVFIPHSFLTSEAGVSFWYCILWLLVQLLFDLLPIQTLTHLSPVHVLLHSPIQHLFMFHFYLFLSTAIVCCFWACVRVLLPEVSVEFPKTLTAAQKDT